MAMALDRGITAASSMRLRVVNGTPSSPLSWTSARAAGQSSSSSRQKVLEAKVDLPIRLFPVKVSERNSFVKEPQTGESRTTDGAETPSYSVEASVLQRVGPSSRMPKVVQGHAAPNEEGVDEVWLKIREEARAAAESEPFLASYLYSAVLAHASLERALSFHLANKIACPTLLSTQLRVLFNEVLLGNKAIQDAVRADLRAVRSRDPACTGYVFALLNFKGFLACQTYRIAHALWARGRHSLALALANRMSQLFGVEIHPAARIGSGILLDHGTGVVIGETAEVGNNVSILHQVTLGGTGTRGGVRHPKVCDGVLIGAGAKLLGPIEVGEGVKIGAGSVVLTDVPAHATVVGNPGQIKFRKEMLMEVPSESMKHVAIDDYVI